MPLVFLIFSKVSWLVASLILAVDSESCGFCYWWGEAATLNDFRKKASV